MDESLALQRRTDWILKQISGDAAYGYELALEAISWTRTHLERECLSDDQRADILDAQTRFLRRIGSTLDEATDRYRRLLTNPQSHRLLR